MLGKLSRINLKTLTNRFYQISFRLQVRDNIDFTRQDLSSHSLQYCVKIVSQGKLSKEIRRHNGELSRLHFWHRAGQGSSPRTLLFSIAVGVPVGAST